MLESVVENRGRICWSSGGGEWVAEGAGGVPSFSGEVSYAHSREFADDGVGCKSVQKVRDGDASFEVRGEA